MAPLSPSKLSRLALLVAAGLALFVFESLMPRPLPWVKPGLAQIATLIALYLWGWQEAVLVVVARVLLGSLLTGSFASPAFWLALPAGVAAAVVMALVRCAGGGAVGMAGVSVIGALVHNLVQLLLIRALWAPGPGLLYLLPLVWLPAVLTGLLVGLAAHLLLNFGTRAGII